MLAVLGAGYWLNDPGYVLVRLGDIAAETTLWGGFLILTAALVVLRLFYVTLRAFLRGSSWLLGWSGQRKAKGLHAHSEKATIALVQGKWLLAQQHFIKENQLGSVFPLSHTHPPPQKNRGTKHVEITYTWVVE